jgi:hypothetical protein
MTQIQERPSAAQPAPSAGAGTSARAGTDERAARSARAARSTRHTRAAVGHLPVWRLNVLRVGYLVMGGGLAVYKWPLLLDRGTWGLEEGTIVSLLVGMSLLALLGLRHPERLLPILLFEVTWKLLWLGVVALPKWRDGTLTGDTLEQTSTVLWVVIIIAVVPWRHVVDRYVTAPGEAWRRRR